MTNVIIREIPPHLADVAWPGISAYVDKLVAKADGRIQADQVLAEFMSGAKALYIAYDAATFKALGFWSQRVDHYGSRAVLSIDYVAGERMKLWLPAGLASIQRYAETHHVDTIEGTSPRRGWARMIESYGFRPFATVYVRDLRHGRQQATFQRDDHHLHGSGVASAERADRGGSRDGGGQ